MAYIGKVPADVLIDPHVDSAAITDGTIITADIADDAVTSAKLAQNSVDSSELIDGSVDNSHLAGSIAVNKTLLSAGTGLTLSTNTLNVDAAQSQITSVGTLTSLALASGNDPLIALDNTGGGSSAIHFKVSGGTVGHIYSDASNNMHFSTVTNNPALELKANANAHFAGTILGVNGSESSPSFAFASDTNTGIFRGAENVLRIVTDGTERVEVQNAQTKITGNTISTGNVLLNPSWSTTNIAFGSATTGHSSNNTGARIEVPLHATGGAAHGSFKFYTNSGDSQKYSLLLSEAGHVECQQKLYCVANYDSQFGQELYNQSSTGHGLKVRGGNSSSQYALFVSNYNQTNTLFQVLGDGQTQCTNTLKVNNDTEAIFRVQRGARYSEAAQNSSGGVMTFYDSSGNMGAQISAYSTNVFANDVKIDGAGTGLSRKLRFYSTNNNDDQKWIGMDGYYNVYHGHHNEGHLFRDQTSELVKIFGNSGGNAETTFGTSSRNNNPRIYGNLRMNVANAASFQNANASETVSLWNGGGNLETVLMCSGGIELRGTTNSQTDSKGRGQINASGSLALNASTTWKTVRTLYGDYQSGILIFHVEDTGNGANTRCQIYAYNADYYERGVNSIDNVTGGVAPGGIEVQIVRDDGSTTSDGGGPYHVQARPANGSSALTVRLLILSAGD